MEDYFEILKKEGLTGKDMADLLGLEYSSYRSMLSRGCPRWVRAFIIGYRINDK